MKTNWINAEEQSGPRDETTFLAADCYGDVYLVRWYPKYGEYAEDGYDGSGLDGCCGAIPVAPCFWTAYDLPPNKEGTEGLSEENWADHYFSKLKELEDGGHFPEGFQY